LIRVFRLNPKRHRATAFSGAGGKTVAGRWNLAGTSIVYSSATESLAFLELFVNVSTITLRSLSRDFDSVEARLTSDAIYEVKLESLPRDWRQLIPSRSTQELGTQWMNEMKYLAIAVPSTIFPGERNYLINPKHPEFSSGCFVQKEQPIYPDPRILAKLA